MKRFLTHPLQGNVAGLLRLLDAVPVVLVRLVMSGVVSGLCHVCNSSTVSNRH